MGRHRFGVFELDANSRCLKADGAKLSVQPLVFDFLAYLAAHQDRAVSKQELLDQLWPGVTVTEASLQRVASVARGILRRGGSHQTLVSVPRFGYRLRLDISDRATAGDVVQQTPDDIAAARAACAGYRWAEAANLYGRADIDCAPSPADLELWALAIECVGRPAEAIEPLSRAVAAYTSAGNWRAAARPAIALAKIHLERGELSVAKGWHSRAGELIGEERKNREYGLWCWMGSRLAAAASETEEALALATKAYELGRSIGDPVVEFARPDISRVFRALSR